ncbi:dentin sialophosphoprotein [Diachasma alloeum]|uniref:dentin sialophosphoprotein n=1 Tax=Diachasma alloeum TaxID=454923 RepID=UPI0007382C1A|nr:dentin sialophosphoprotein [Diachasma alloeum]
MPRGTKESEDDLEPRARRTRATAHSVTNSPLRRSTRNRQTTKDDSSPESVTSDAGPSTRTRRRRTPTLESMQAEPVRSLRSRKTSTTSDVSETTESETGGEGKKRTTRKSLVAPLGIETPIEARLRRTTRAGSESKSISPMVRLTRRTRASSVDPDTTKDRSPTTPSTPLRSGKQRASVLPSELPVVEEIEKHPKALLPEDEDVFLMESTPSQPAAPSPSTPLPQKPGPAPVEETRESLEASLEALITFTTPKTPPKSSDSRQEMMDNASDNALKDLPKVLVEKAHLETSPGNKENEKAPRITSERPLKFFRAASTDRKSQSSTVLECLEVDSRSNIDNKLSKSSTPGSKLMEKVITMESDLADKGLEEKEDSIIFVDDTDTDEAPLEVFRNDKSSEKPLNDDEIIIAAVGNDEMSPCKSQTPEDDGPGEDSKPEVPKESSEGVEQEEDPVEAQLKNLFRDIPAEEWQSGSCKSPVNVEDEEKSDTGSDIVLVGWSADENELEEKAKENFSYDSDDIVVMQKRKEMSAREKATLEEVGEDTEMDDEGNLQRKSGKSSRKSTDDVGAPGGKNRKSASRRSLETETDSDEGECTNPDLEEELNKSRELIYRFESGIIDFSEDFEKFKRKSRVVGQGKKSDAEESGESRKSRLWMWKSLGRRGDDDQEEKSEVAEGLDQSGKSISSELRKSLGKSNSPVGDNDEAMDVDVDGDEEMSRPESDPREIQMEVPSDDESIEVDKPEDEKRNARHSETPLSPSKKMPVLERQPTSPRNAEEIMKKCPEKSRKSLSRKSIHEGKNPVEQKEKEDSIVDEEDTSPKIQDGVDKSTRSANQSGLRVSLSKIQTPVKQKQSSSLEEDRGPSVQDKSESITSRKSLPVSKTPLKLQQNDEKFSSEDEDPEEITRKFNKSKGVLAQSCEKAESSSLEEKTELTGNEDAPEVKKTLEKSRSLRTLLRQPQSNGDDEKTSQKRNSLTVEKSSSEEKEDEQEDDEGTPEVEEGLNKSEKSLRRSLTQSKTNEDDEKTSLQKRKSLAVEKSSDEDDDEETPEVEEGLNQSEKSLRRSLTQSKTNDDEEKTSLQKRKCLAVEKSSNEEDDEETPEVEEGFNKSKKSLRISSTQPKENEGDEKTSQKRKSLAVEEFSSEEEEDEETPEVEETLDKSRKSLRKSLTQSKQNGNEDSENSGKTSEEKDDDDDDDDEDTPEIEELKKTWRNLRRSLSKSNIPLKQEEDEESEESEKTSQKRKSLTVEKSSSEEEENDEETPGVEETLNKSRKSLRKSLIESQTPSKQNEDESKKSPKTSQKRRSLTIEKSSSSEEEEDEAPEVEEPLNKSLKSLRKSLNESKTPSKQNENESEKSKKSSPQKRISLVVEKSSSDEDEETPEVEEALNESTKNLRSLIKSKTPSKQNEDETSKKSPKPSPQKRKSLTIESSSLSEDAEKELEDNVEGKRSVSTQVQVNSNSESDEDIDSDVEQSRVVSSLFFGEDSDSSDSDVNSDIAREYNLNGASSEEHSDDDVPGDDLNGSDNVDGKRSVSTQVQVNSNSESDEDIDSDVEQSRVVSSLFFGEGSDSSDSDINSDIEREYNLNGASSEEHSDDDVTGDDLNGSDFEEASDKEDAGEEFDDFINDDDHDDEEEEEEDETLGIDEEEESEVSVSPPKPTKKDHEKLNLRANKNLNELEDTSVKKPKSSTSEVLRTPKPSTPGVPKASEKPKQTPKSLPPLKKPKLAKKSEMNLTMIRDDSELADTRLLMKEKLNDSMPILKMKRMSCKRSDLEILPEDKSDEVKEGKKKKKSKSNKHKIPEGDDPEEIEEVNLEVSDKKSKKKKKKLNSSEKMSFSPSRNESTKRKKNKEIDVEMNPEVPKPKKKKIQVVKLVDSDSDDEPEVLSFSQGRGQALAALKREQESIRATKEAKSQKKIKGNSGNSSVIPRKTIKRLPEETLDNLSDVPLRPKKKRKINHDVFMPTRTMFDDENKKPRSMNIDDEFMPLSLSGGTTTFEVVSLRKKKERKTSSRSFRERMMNRVSRQPISAFMVHQQKLQASGKNKY